jgi:hypothetical protein
MIPKRIFFILFPPLDNKSGNRPFSLLHYLAIKSAHDCNPSYDISLYCKEEPTGEWWDMIKSVINLVFIDPPTEVFGNTLHHVAHQSDVVRLRTLIEHGGIYLDMDTITAKSFDSLMNYPAVMGFEGKRGSGICNAVIFSEPNNTFICDWYNEYKTFSSKGKDKDWGTHSIKLPLKMWNSGDYIQCMKVLSYDTFHYPLWDKKGSVMIWEETHKFPNAIIHHVWESKNKKYTSELSVKKIRDEDSTYNIIARKYL